MTVEEYARQPREARLARLALTPNQLAAALAGRSDELLTVMAWHDDNHLDQLARALEGRA